MDRHRAGLALSLLLLAGAGIFAQAPSASAAAHNVSVADSAFIDATSSGSTTTISAGESVTWTWSGSLMHSVTADNASFDSDPPTGSRTTGTFVFSFGTPGTYAYYCRVHGAPGGQGMSGTIVVQAAAPASTSTAQATSTPVTPSATPQSTQTPISTGTPAPALTPTPAVAASPVAPPQPESGAGGAVRLPGTGAGEEPGVPPVAAAIVLALLGGATLGGALLARLRA